jgi:hypothetical protein
MRTLLTIVSVKLNATTSKSVTMGNKICQGLFVAPDYWRPALRHHSVTATRGRFVKLSLSSLVDREDHPYQQKAPRSWPERRVDSVRLLIAIQALLFAAVSLAGCSRDLSRDEAQKALNASRFFTPGQSFSYRLGATEQKEGCVWPPPEPGFAEGMYAREVRSVTGITGSDGTARVEFNWDWKEHSPDRDKCLGGSFSRPAKAEFQRYDDGWRVMAVQFGDWD